MSNPAPSSKKIRTITLEEHYATHAFMEGPGLPLKERAQAVRDHPHVASMFANLVENLCDVGKERIAQMDAAGIDVQVLSLTSPGTEQLEATEAVKVARETNDFLAEAVKSNPDRFAGFAALPTSAPDKAADELERTVKEYGFKGALINGHSRGRYLDDKFFWPILERAEELKVPIYLHPTLPPQQVVQTYYTGNFSQEVTAALALAGWGWHIETAVHVLRLILSGAFDRYPGLQLVIGHLGEGLPFMMQRLEVALPTQVTKLPHPFVDYLRNNVHYTFSGFNFLPDFLNLYLQVGVERIMFSTDYPYASMEQARGFLDQLPLSPNDKERIAHGNAEQLFHF